MVSSVAPNSTTNWTIPYFPEFALSLANYTAVIHEANDDTISAHSFCNIFTIARIFPFIVLFILVIYLAGAILSIPVTVLQAGVTLTVQLITFSHTD
jgi:ABC-type methionine transport system permease subunit